METYMAETSIVGIVIGLGVTIIGALAVWLTRSKIERVEADVSGLDMKKTEAAICMVRHDSLEQQVREKAAIIEVQRIDQEKAAKVICDIRHFDLDRRLSNLSIEQHESTNRLSELIAGQNMIVTAINTLNATIINLKDKIE